MLLFALSTATAAEVDIPPHVQERADRALEAVDATEEQRSLVYRLIEDVVPKAKALHDEAHALREEIHEVMMTPQIDRKALEDLRVDAVDLFDRATAFAFPVFAELAEIFTPEQRQTLHELRRHEFVRRFHGPDAG